KKAAAAAAGWNSAANASTANTPTLDPSAQFITSTMRASVDAITNRNASMSAAVVDESEKPKIAVDPMMAGNSGAARTGVSFSEMDELPPLKEIYVAPPPPPKAEEEQEAAEPLPSIVLRNREPEKPKIQPREVAQKAIKEIK